MCAVNLFTGSEKESQALLLGNSIIIMIITIILCILYSADKTIDGYNIYDKTIEK